MALINDEQIDMRIADVPTAPVDAPVDQDEIERALRKGGINWLGTTATEVAEVISKQLPTERLLVAKAAELDLVQDGAYCLVESSWHASQEFGDIRLELADLHAPDRPGGGRVSVPTGLRVRTEIEAERLSDRARQRLTGKIDAAVFGEILSTGASTVVIWPIVICSRALKVHDH